MAEYIWQGKSREGMARSGELEAVSKNMVMLTLRRQGLLELKVKKKPVEIHLFPEKVTDKEITIFFRQLSTMINAGVPLVQAFELAEKGSSNKTFVKLLRDLRSELEGGVPLGETLRKFPKYFDTLSCSLVQAGEQGGILDSILLRLCAYREKSQALKAKIKSAMVYPVTIITVAFIVTAVLMIFVIPVFAKMFSEFGGQLPMPTQIAITVSNIFVQYWYAVVFAPILLILAIRRAYKTKPGRYRLDQLLLNLPVLGDVLRKASVARFCRTFSTLTAAGVPVLESLDTVGETAGNVIVEKAILKAKESITQGQTLSAPLIASGIFPRMVTQMINIGEETGSMEIMLSKIADFYEQEVDSAVDNMTALMEPFIMVFLGVVIGGLVISMYLPIFKMASLV